LVRIEMLNKLVVSSPVTQSREAVEQLITYHNHGQQPVEMPDFYRLTGEMVLVLNNKKDAYYVTTPKSCSCPAATYHPGQPCKHSRKYFPKPKPVEEPTIDLRASLPGWRGPDGQRANGPVEAI
jgi:hypothetical protein